MLGRPERAFLLSALFSRALDPERLRSLAAGGLDWRALESSARVTGVLPLLASAVAAAGGDALASGERGERLRAALEQNAARNALLARELAELDAALRAGGHEVVALKGAALVALDAGYAPLRHLDDLDLLVPVESAEAVLGALRRSGLVISAARDPRLEHGHHPDVVVTRSGVPVELHVRLGDDVEGGEARAAAIRSRSTRGNRLGVRIPAPEDVLGVAAWHALVHHRFELAYVPRLLADVHALVALGADPAAAAARHDGARERPVAWALALLDDARRAAARPSRAGAAPSERPFSRARRAAKRAQGAWVTSGARLVRSPVRLLFPPRDFMAARYGVPVRSRLLPLLYLYRPFRGLFRALTGI